MVRNKLFLLLVILISISFISGCSDGQVNVNTASLEDLDKIIWVGSVTAQNIIDVRPFNSVDDLIKVSGIGEIKLQDIKDQGLSCVGKSEEIVNEDNATKEQEIIKVKSEPEENSEEVKKVIKANPKVINTEDDTSKLIKGEYALIGLAFFSMLIIFLLVLKLRTGDKNEFD